MPKLKQIRVYDIDPELHRNFKASCDLYGVTMREVLLSHMKSIVDAWQRSNKYRLPPKTDDSKGGKSE